MLENFTSVFLQIFEASMTTKKYSRANFLKLLALATFVGLIAAAFKAFGWEAMLAFMANPAVAAWVQAFGAVGAVGIAIWIARSSDRSTQRDARTTAKHFIQMASAAVGGLSVSARVHSEEADVQKKRFLGELSEVQFIGRAVNIAQLPPDLCACVLTARRLVASAYELGIDIRERTPPRNQPVTGALAHMAPRDGYTIALSLLKASYEELKETEIRVGLL